MGKGDARSKKGKISKGSFGNSRPQRAGKKATEVVATAAAAPAAEEKPKKAAAKKA